MPTSVYRALWSLFGLVLVITGCRGSQGPQSEPERAPPFDAEVVLASPDGRLRIEVGTDLVGRPRYRVVRTHADGDELVVGDSSLGLELTTADGQRRSLVDGFVIGPPSPAETVVDEFDLPTGKARRGSLTARTQRVEFVDADAATTLALDLWVDDHAVAFRYVADAVGRLEWERTSVAMPADATAWLQRHDQPGQYTPAYEQLWREQPGAARPLASPWGWAFPALFESDESWTLVTEADVRDGDAGSHLSAVVDDGEYFIDLAHRDEGNGIGDPRPVIEDGWTSPWRVIINSPHVGDIVASDHVRHLSSGPEADNSWSWVEPGRVSWSWWSDHESSRDADAIEPFIDLAASLGWEYSLVDANWTDFDDRRLDELVAYADDRDVGLFLWYNSGGSHNVVTEAPRDRMADREVRRAELARISALGIRGIKVDFFHSDKPDRIQQYLDILADAADVELLVNFHGSTMPRGWERRFPNLMTMEAVRGAEIYTFDPSYAAAAPRQNTVLPFTRNVVGSMDYTPVMLGDTERRRTTNGHELALAVVFESGLQHLVDTPDAYLDQPTAVIELLAAVPVVWDETQLIEGRPGSHVAIARRHGEQWWIGAINGTDEPITVDLSALDAPGDGPVTRVCDNPAWDRTPGLASTWDDPTQYLVADHLGALELVPFGGCLIRIG